MEAADSSIGRGSAYAAFLQRAGLADLSDIEALQLFYRGGVDARGRPVFLFWAGHLPARPVDRERVLMHIMRTLDAYVHSGYIIIYIHTTLSPENEPPFAWLRKVYELFDKRLKDNLCAPTIEAAGSSYSEPPHPHPRPHPRNKRGRANTKTNRGRTRTKTATTKTK